MMETRSMRDKTFRYGPALLGARLVRVIKLNPSWNGSAPLHISLKTVCVDKFSDYDCLSYTWDEQVPERLIYCDGKLMLITANVDTAMRRFRRKHRPRWLWIDAVCINQACVEEKNAQVSMMADIYRSARKVLVWLGPSTEETKKAIAYCHRAAYIPLKRTPGLELPAPPEETKVERLTKRLNIRPNVKRMLKEDYRLSVQKGFDQIAGRSYWTRIWTVQEIALGRRSELYVGDSTPVSFERLLYAYLVQEYYPDGAHLEFGRDRSIRALAFHSNCLYHVRGKGAWDQARLASITSSLMVKKSAEPRDICFAIKAIYPDLLGDIEVRYDGSVADIYTELAASLFGQIWGTKLLGGMLDVATMCLPKSLSVPSWVPDWSSEETQWSDYKVLFNNATCDSRAAGMLSTDNRSLYLLGKVVDTVLELVGEPFPDWSIMAVTIQPTSEVYAALKNIHRILATLQEPTGHGDLASQFYSMISTLSYAPCLEGIHHYLHHSFDDNTDLAHGHTTTSSSLLTSQTVALIPMDDKLSCRQVFLTAQGRVGLGRAVQPGDDLVLLAGTQHPYVIRHNSPKNGYELQASAIVADAMLMGGDLWSSIEDSLEYICFV
ncbi:heterokaryon incompatibility protein-domain-containing protein [Hypomontagnella monticulosa]|nr:heterokaryon incompatibility protein-domain-containing protein [Hypomontagnella monticulosa]